MLCFTLREYWVFLLYIVHVRKNLWGIRAIGRIIIHFDIRLDITGTTVRLEAVSKETRLLGVYRLDVNVPFDIIGVWRGHNFCELSLEQRSAYG